MTDGRAMTLAVSHRWHLGSTPRQSTWHLPPTKWQ